jgi:hypothetical protein
LGFIVGNPVGAVYGYHAAGGLYDLSHKKTNMNGRTPPRSSRKRARSQSRGRSMSRTPSVPRARAPSRRRTRSLGRSSSRARSSSRSGNPRQYSGTERQPGVKGRLKVSRKRKSLRVSPVFRKAVKLAMKSAMVPGDYIYRVGDKISVDRTTCPGNLQAVYSNGYSAAGGGSVFGSYNQILDAFSILWNGKPADKNHFLQAKNFGVNLAGTICAGGFEGEVNFITRKFHMKNNYNVVMHCRIYDCVRKRDTDDDVATVNQSAVKLWEAGLVSDIPLQTTTDFTLGPNIGIAGADAANSNPVTHKTLGSVPQLSKAFTRYWSTSHEDVTLEPGQTFDWTVKIPGFKFVQSKYITPGTQDAALTNDFIKGVTHDFMIAVYPEFQTAVDGKGAFFGVIAGAVLSGSSGIWLQWTDHYSLKCPDQTVTYQHASSLVSNDAQPGLGSLHRRAYVVLNNLDSQSNNAVERFDEENPRIDQAGG